MFSENSRRRAQQSALLHICNEKSFQNITLDEQQRKPVRLGVSERRPLLPCPVSSVFLHNGRPANAIFWLSAMHEEIAS